MLTLDTRIMVTAKGLDYLRTRSLTEDAETRTICICGRTTTGAYGGSRYCSRCLAFMHRLDAQEVKEQK